MRVRVVFHLWCRFLDIDEVHVLEDVGGAVVLADDDGAVADDDDEAGGSNFDVISMRKTGGGSGKGKGSGTAVRCRFVVDVLSSSASPGSVSSLRSSGT